jgi:hypothetical protein
MRIWYTHKEDRNVETKLTEFERGRLSAIIDSGGWVFLRKTKGRNAVTYIPRITVMTSNRAILSVLLRFPNLIRIYGPIKRKIGQKSGYIATVVGRERVNCLLQQIELPSKRIKKRLLLSACRLLENKPEGHLMLLEEIRQILKGLRNE